MDDFSNSFTDGEIFEVTPKNIGELLDSLINYYSYFLKGVNKNEGSFRL